MFPSYLLPLGLCEPPGAWGCSSKAEVALPAPPATRHGICKQTPSTYLTINFHNLERIPETREIFIKCKLLITLRNADENCSLSNLFFFLVTERQRIFLAIIFNIPKIALKICKTHFL